MGHIAQAAIDAPLLFLGRLPVLNVGPKRWGIQSKK